MAFRKGEMVSNSKKKDGTLEDKGTRVKVKKNTYAAEFTDQTGTVEEYERFPIRPHWVTVKFSGGKTQKFREIDLVKVK